jgi:hypothetical protein
MARQVPLASEFWRVPDALVLRREQTTGVILANGPTVFAVDPFFQ